MADKRKGRVELTTEAFHALLALHLKDYPRDAHISSFYFDANRDVIGLILEHESMPMISEGNAIPIMGYHMKQFGAFTQPIISDEFDILNPLLKSREVISISNQINTAINGEEA